MKAYLLPLTSLLLRFRGIGFSSFVIAVCLASTLPVLAQSTSLRGQVKDTTGAAIPRAKITATSDTGKVLSTVSVSDGSYRLLAIPGGTYQVQVTVAGFDMKTPASFVAPVRLRHSTL